MWSRIFSRLAANPDPALLLESLQASGFQVQSHFRGDDLGWFGCEFHLGEGTPIFLERFLSKEDELRDELNTWAAWVEAQDYEPNRFSIMERLIQSHQLFTLRKPIDHADEVTLDRFCDAVVNWLATQTDGLIQIDGKGFFDASGRLLLEEY
jgi:hypothetical protein